MGRSRGMAPRYDCQWVQDGRCRAHVQIGNTLSFVGSLSRTYDQAMESAASVAVFNMVSGAAVFCVSGHVSVFSAVTFPVSIPIGAKVIF